jgi:acyl carrier protein
VELGEIEVAVAEHPAVAQCVAVVRDERLIAYVVPRAGDDYAKAHAQRITPEGLIEWIAGRLPDYMVPGAVVILDQLPLSANGKVDRAALPEPGDTASAEEAYVAPRNETEEAIAAIWAEVLKKESVGVTENFITLGGHSLLAIRVLGRISKTFGVRLPLRTLFDAPTIDQLAPRIDAERTPAAAAAPEAGLISRSRDAYRIGRPATPGSDSEPGA